MDDQTVLRAAPATALYVYFGSLAPAAAELIAAAETPGTARTVAYVAGLLATIILVAVATRIARRALDTALRGDQAVQFEP